MTSVELPDIEEPLPYHAAIRDYLKQEEREVWQWYASNRVRAEHAEASRFDLLKKTYRADRNTQKGLYELADDAARRLSLDIAITIYHAQQPEGLNASLTYLPGEAHVVLHGPVAERLNEEELRALFAHELAHMMLYELWDGDLLIASQVLSAMTHDRNADTSHFATARLFNLYTEVFCDRTASRVVADHHDVVSMLVKITTGLGQVDPQSYLRQADEILGRSPAASAGLSHPEEYIRAHVLKLWHEQGGDCDKRVAELIEGRPRLNELDLIAQRRVGHATRRLIDAFFEPEWTHTDLLLAHARLFFGNYDPKTHRSTAGDSAKDLRETLASSHRSIQDYCCYVLLDFASADRELATATLAQAFEITEHLRLGKRFSELAAKELRLRKKQVEQIRADRKKLIAAAARVETEA